MLNDPLIALVGVPYKADGRSRAEGLDCKGLVMLAQAERGVVLPDNHISWRKCVTLLGRPFVIRRYDILFFAEGDARLVNHMGVAISPTDFIHCSDIFGGVVCQPIRRYPGLIDTVGRIEPS